MTLEGNQEKGQSWRPGTWGSLPMEGGVLWSQMMLTGLERRDVGNDILFRFNRMEGVSGLSKSNIREV